jgi:hypothetical protein
MEAVIVTVTVGVPARVVGMAEGLRVMERETLRVPDTVPLVVGVGDPVPLSVPDGLCVALAQTEGEIDSLGDADAGGDAGGRILLTLQSAPKQLNPRSGSSGSSS